MPDIGPWKLTPVERRNRHGKSMGGVPRRDSACEAAGSLFTANGQPRASRAAQFMPFAALTGYYELARKQERLTEAKHELTEEEAEELSRTILQVKRGDLIRVTYYDWDRYRTLTGIVARIEPTFRRLQVVKAVIAFDDIRTLERSSSEDSRGFDGLREP